MSSTLRPYISASVGNEPLSEERRSVSCTLDLTGQSISLARFLVAEICVCEVCMDVRARACARAPRALVMGVAPIHKYGPSGADKRAILNSRLGGVRWNYRRYVKRCGYGAQEVGIYESLALDGVFRVSVARNIRARRRSPYRCD